MNRLHSTNWRLELRVSNVRIQNLDTVAVPFELMEPKDWNRLYNTITLDSEDSSNNLTVIMAVELDIGGADSPLRMKNQVDISVTLPSTSLSLEILASMNVSLSAENVVLMASLVVIPSSILVLLHWK
jgi:hypothetical protein